MPIEQTVLIWIIAGILLVLAEILVPGLIIIFFGASALVVALLIWLGLVGSYAFAIGLWLFMSLVLVLVFRRVARKIFPSRSSYRFVEDDVGAIGSEVKAVADIDDTTFNGRIEYAGTSWQARSKEGTIPAGSRVRLLYRDNIHWVVEPVEEDEESGP
jgi:membrane protein implicated in regulation of membrane protease activity